jgi:hypothetical protein
MAEGPVHGIGDTFRAGKRLVVSSVFRGVCSYLFLVFMVRIAGRLFMGGLT